MTLRAERRPDLGRLDRRIRAGADPGIDDVAVAGRLKFLDEIGQPAEQTAARRGRGGLRRRRCAARANGLPSQRRRAASRTDCPGNRAAKGAHRHRRSASARLPPRESTLPGAQSSKEISHFILARRLRRSSDWRLFILPSPASVRSSKTGSGIVIESSRRDRAPRAALSLRAWAARPASICAACPSRSSARSSCWWFTAPS